MKSPRKFVTPPSKKRSGKKKNLALVGGSLRLGNSDYVKLNQAKNQPLSEKKKRERLIDKKFRRFKFF